MLKRYLPVICLAAAALLLYYIKTNQRGAVPEKAHIEAHNDRVTVPAILPTEDQQKKTGDPETKGFNRNAGQLIFSKHARCRMDCRHIDESEVKDILKNGEINRKKIQSDKRGMTYPVEGYTRDKQRVRIVFAPRGEDALVVVTVIDLETEWKCDCK